MNILEMGREGLLSPFLFGKINYIIKTEYVEGLLQCVIEVLKTSGVPVMNAVGEILQRPDIVAVVGKYLNFLKR